MSKAKKVNIDAMLSSDEESVEQPKKVVKGAAATTKPVKGKPAKKDSDDESSSEEEITILKNKTKRDAEEVKGKQAVSANTKTVAKTVKKPVEPSDSDEESSEEVKPVKKAVPATKAPAKKQESSDDESSEEAKPVKKAVAQTKPATKAPAKKQESSDEESEDEKPQAKKPVTKAPAKKEESSDEEESDDEPVAKPQAKTNGNGHQATSTSNSGCMELFVKNLGWKTDENTLGSFFGNYGDVQSVKILYDRETGRSKGLAFVGFASRDQAQAALNDAANLNVDGRLLTVSFSDEKPQRDGNQGGFGGNRGGNQGGYGGNQGGYGGNQGGNRGGNYGGEKHTVFVGNLGFKSNENGIKNFFRDCGNVIDVRIAKNEEGRSKGFCHVDFDSAEAVEKAKGKAGQDLDGRELRVDASTPRQGGGSRGGFGGRGGRGGGRGGRGGNMNPMDRAKKTGAMISNPGAVKTFDDDDD